MKPSQRDPLANEIAQLFRAPVAAAVIRRINAAGALEGRLAPVDRWLWRWAASSGSGLPFDPEPFRPRIRVPPLDPDDAIVTDQVICRAPNHWDDFVHGWYRSDKTTEEIARTLGLGPRVLYVEQKVVLGYLLGQFLARGLRLPRYPGL